MEPWVIVVGIVLLVAGVALVTWFLAWRRFSGVRVVTCPETHQHVAVEVDAMRAAKTAILEGHEELRLRDCTRWPEKRHCDQACLHEVEENPEACLARVMLAGWFEGKACAFCAKKFEKVHWHDHKPVFLDPRDQITIAWEDIKPEAIPAVLATHAPVCWNCHIAESFRREHADLVTDRPWKKHASG